MDIYYLVIIDIFKYIALVMGLMVLVRARRRALWLESLIAATVAIFLLHLFAVSRHDLIGHDFRFFWKAGRDVWAGLDPYAADRFADHPFLNAPTALPLFALLAVVPFRLSLALWTVASVLASLALVALAQYTLKVQSRLDHRADAKSAELWRLPPLAIAGLSICLSFSDSSLWGFYLGQLNVFVTVMLLAALVAQGKNRPVCAGFWLALATVKVGTMLPFLLLFLRKADRWTWVSLAVLVLGFCSLTGRMTELPGRLATIVDRIGELSAPGKVNDYSFEGPRNASIIGFEPLFYRLGLRDRATIRSAQYVALLAAGACVAYLVVWSGLSRPAACALIALYSLLFLYHRNYDAVILALPLVYGACEARAASGRGRWPFTAIGLLALAIFYLNEFLLIPLTRLTREWGGWGRLVQATVLPYATWLILLSMILLVWSSRLTAVGTDESIRLKTVRGV